MNIKECIITVNEDIANSIKDFFMGIPKAVTMKFYKTHTEALILPAICLAILASTIGSLILGIHVATWVFPGNHTAFTWLPIGFIWTLWLLIMYVCALYNKCKES